MEDYGIAAYRSRTQVLRLEAQLKRDGIPCAVVSTPREVALGCGLSVRFDLVDLERVRRAVSRVPTQGLIGLYQVGSAHRRSRFAQLVMRL